LANLTSVEDINGQDSHIFCRVNTEARERNETSLQAPTGFQNLISSPHPLPKLVCRDGNRVVRGREGRGMSEIIEDMPFERPIFIEGEGLDSPSL
jgi:hypothetical protein